LPPIFAGRDGAGKGGAIKALTERVFSMVALPAPTGRALQQTLRKTDQPAANRQKSHRCQDFAAKFGAVLAK
jgi:polyphosphate kinase 2 (PPK2 family)